MPKVSPIQGNFGTGETSPFYQGRVDTDRYQASLTTCKNYIPTLQGGLTRRPGTEFIIEVKTSSKKTRIIPFKFSATDAYILEFGDLYIRFYKDYGQVQLDAAAYEIVTTYTESEIFALNFNQSADVLYLTHPSHVPMKLSRYAPTQWVLTELDRSKGPFEYLEEIPGVTITGLTGAQTVSALGSAFALISAITNNGGHFEVTLASGHTDATRALTKVRVEYTSGTPSAAGDWDVTVTATGYILVGSTYSGTYGGSGASVRTQAFTAIDVGRYIRLQEFAKTTFGVAKITAVTDSKTVSVAIEADDPIPALVTGSAYNFKKGLWYAGNGPAASCFFEDRLFFVGTPSASQRLDGSKTGDYENFETIDQTGAIVSSNAVSFVLNSNDVNAGKWLFSDEKGLLSGTLAGEWTVKSASNQEALSPTSISAKQTSNHGSAACYPVQVGKAVLFVQASGRKLREYMYFYDVDGFRATDLSILSEHITQSGIKQLAYQKDPQQVVWAVKENGELIGLTYDRDVDNLRAGWHRHPLGGGGLAESVAVIPSPDGTKADVWLIVKRYVNGSYKRYLEVLTNFFEDDTDQKDAFFVDCGLTYDAPKTITAISLGADITITAVAHGFSDADEIVISDIVGTTELNDNVYTIKNKTTDTFQLVSTDGSAFSTYVSGGEVRKRVSTITGLSHLEGASVDILGDGAVMASQTVSSGSITLPSKAGTVQVGLGYSSDAQLPRINAGAADGTALGKTRRINRVGFLVYRSLGLQFGQNFSDMTQLDFEAQGTYIAQADELQSKIISESASFDYDFENQICFRQNQPLPSTILAVMPQMTTQDR